MKPLLLIFPILAFATAGFAAEPAEPGAAKRMMKITTRIIEGPAAAFPPGAAVDAATLKARLVEITEEEGWDIVSAPTVVAREGQKAKVEIGRTILLAPDADPLFAGHSVEIVGRSTPDGTVQIDAHGVITEAVEGKGKPASLLTFEQKLDIIIPTGRTFALVVPTGHPDKFTTFLITSEWIDAAGKVIP